MFDINNLDNEQKFLLELAALQIKYNVAICSRVTPSGRYSEVFYSMGNRLENSPEFKIINTGRLHSTGYETLLFTGMTCKQANAYNAELSEKFNHK